MIRQLQAASSKLNQLDIPEKIYLDNPNQLYAISSGTQNQRTVRELFFLNMLSVRHQVTAPKQGDFLVDHTFLFEIGGRNKKPKPTATAHPPLIVCDDIESTIGTKIPLWLFGFLY